MFLLCMCIYIYIRVVHANHVYFGGDTDAQSCWDKLLSLSCFEALAIFSMGTMV